MKVTFFGAAGEVTGSGYLLETGSARVLIDFGLHQGEREADEHNRFPDDLDVSKVHAVILTHAHIDHSGRLPMLTSRGYSGPVWSTPATRELTDLLLKDTAHLQASDIARQNANRRPGEPLVKAMYELADVELLMRLFRTIPYETQQEVAPGITARFRDAGHILGSASLELTITENGKRSVVVFSGDIGPGNIPILRDPQPFVHADVLFLETTYGDRDHKPRDETVKELQQILTTCSLAGCGKILIPAFAVGRTQDMIYEMSRLYRAKLWAGFPVYIDSPMGIETTQLYKNHPELFDDDARELLKNGDSPLNFPLLKMIRTAEESKKLNFSRDPMVVIAGSGMCTGGRIVHHLLHGLSRPDTQVVIVGYQGQGTLGRRLVDGAKQVRIFGVPVEVRATIHTLGGFSAHAGQSVLAAWAKAVNPKPKRLILTHGEPAARDALAAKLEREWGVKGEKPTLDQTMEL
jgi:metallo-beta-lactamase family protein